jgi:hypothetical protein
MRAFLLSVKNADLIDAAFSPQDHVARRIAP